MAAPIFPIIGLITKVTSMLSEMKKRDLLLIGFVVLFVILIGSLTGTIPTPLTKMETDHATLLQNEKDRKDWEKELLDVARLQLYLGRETCMHGAETESEKSRCDRIDIRDAIIGDTLSDDFSASISTAL